MPQRVVELRSDTKTQPTAGMRAAIAAAVVGDEQANEDPSVIRLLEVSRPTRNASRTTTPAPFPLAPAAARKIRTCVGVSAPTPWIIPTPNAVRRP